LRPSQPTQPISLSGNSVVVAVLAIADLVAGQDQRQALGQQQARELVFPKLAAKCDNRCVVGRAFMAAIVAVIVVRAVTVFLAITLIVLFIVAEQVRQRETIMDGSHD